MSDTLRDQLLGLGFKAAPKPEKKPQGKPPRRDGQPTGHKQGGKPAPKAGQGRPAHKPKGGEMDLAKAYAIRAQTEKDERIEAERQKQEAARLRREARAKLAEFLAGKELNDAAAEIARHF